MTPNPSGAHRYLATKRWRREISTLPRVGSCMRRPIPLKRGRSPALVHSAAAGARFRNVQRCGSVWACPECAAILATARVADIRRAIARAERLGYTAAWQTLTLPHDAPDGLRQSLGFVTEAWRRIRSGSAWRRLAAELGVVGTIRKTEVTHGVNGWHPHLHLTFLSDRPLEELELARLEAYVYRAWAALAELGGFRRPKPELCPLQMLRLDTPAWADYLGKMLGWELAGERKETRALAGATPFELLEGAAGVAARNWRGHPNRAAFLAADPSVRLWREFERQTKGRRQLVWSHGLKRRLGLYDRTEEEELELGDALLAEKEEVVYLFAPREWSALWAEPGRLAALLAVANEPAPLEERRRAVQFLVEGWFVTYDRAA